MGCPFVVFEFRVRPIGHFGDDNMMGEGNLAGGGHVDGVDFLGNEGFVIGGVETLGEDGLECWHENQVKQVMTYCEH
jgi:hypothetical protein